MGAEIMRAFLETVKFVFLMAMGLIGAVVVLAQP
jgi:hypothetical protein